mmetsp:Transcript_17340/g.30892  ORF Transcript_17340/g.30892 Transcript_17340/m.30892 type:complete len:86 (-) Transcript_17340:156-413(-)
MFNLRDKLYRIITKLGNGQQTRLTTMLPAFSSSKERCKEKHALRSFTTLVQASHERATFLVIILAAFVIADCITMSAVVRSLLSP